MKLHRIETDDHVETKYANYIYHTTPHHTIPHHFIRFYISLCDTTFKTKAQQLANL